MLAIVVTERRFLLTARERSPLDMVVIDCRLLVTAMGMMGVDMMLVIVAERKGGGDGSCSPEALRKDSAIESRPGEYMEVVGDLGSVPVSFSFDGAVLRTVGNVSLL